MTDFSPVITGIGVVAPNGIGKENFWKALEEGKDCAGEISGFPTDDFSVKVAAEVRNFDPSAVVGPKGLRNLDRSALFLVSASKLCLDDARLVIDDSNTDDFGICTGTTFSHFWSLLEFDREVFTEGIEFASPALFPSTVMNAASSQVSIRFNIQGFNATVSTGYTSGLEALKYSILALETGKAKTVLCAAVDTLSYPLFFGFHKLGYMAGIKGLPISCPFDKRRNGPVLGEAATVLCIEDEKCARERNVPILARVKSVANYYDTAKMGKIKPGGDGLEKAIRQVLDEARIAPQDIDYISSCANSAQDLDRIEAKVLQNVFGNDIGNIPVSSIKSMIGETFSPASTLQIISSIGAMNSGRIPPTINFSEADPACSIDCVPNTAREKKINNALITSFGPGGHNSACIIEKYTS